MDINGTAWKLLSYCYTVKGIASENSTGPRSPPHGFSSYWKANGWGLTVLFNLSSDPGEQRDVSDEHPDIKEKLLVRLASCRQKRRTDAVEKAISR